MATPEKKSDGSGGVILVIVVIAIFFALERDEPASVTPSSSQKIAANSTRRIARDTALALYWDDICQYLNGSETVVACSVSGGGGCYDLDAEISSCTIDTVYFPNGGFLNVAATIDESGSASDFDNQGRLWDFEFDMNSMLIDDAIEEWAQAEGYVVE